MRLWPRSDDEWCLASLGERVQAADRVITELRRRLDDAERKDRAHERRVLRLRLAWDLYVASGDLKDSGLELVKALETAEEFMKLDERLFGGAKAT